MKKVLFNLSNIVKGGGLQVAISFLIELNKVKPKFEYQILVSKEIYNLVPINNQNIKVSNTKFFDLFNPFKIYYFNKFDVIFNLFGPNYILTKAINISGFAQPNILFSNSQNGKFSKFKFLIQKQFFSLSKFLIVEHNYIKEIIEKEKIFSNRIFVAENSINNIFLDKTNQKDVDINIDPKKINIGLLSNYHKHKNLEIVKDLEAKLLNKNLTDFKIHLTLSEKEFQKLNINSSLIFNVGRITINQCPSFIKKMDYILCPSNLECFSATPLESIFIGTTVICSNKIFYKKTCFDYAIYFDDTEDIINLIIKNEKNNKNDHKEFILENYNPKNRFLKYLEILDGI